MNYTRSLIATVMVGVCVAGTNEVSASSWPSQTQLEQSSIVTPVACHKVPKAGGGYAWVGCENSGNLRCRDNRCVLQKRPPFSPGRGRQPRR
jgi:hypothetical protein